MTTLLQSQCPPYSNVLRAGDPLPTLSPRTFAVAPFRDEAPLMTGGLSTKSAAPDADAVASFVAGSGCVYPAKAGDCVQLNLYPDADPAAAAPPPDAARRRFVLAGVADNKLVALERTQPPGDGPGFDHVALAMPADLLPRLIPLQQGRCRHCGYLVPLDEAELHLARVHRNANTVVDDETGVAYGDVGLLRRLERATPEQIGQGAQGVVWRHRADPPVVKDGESEGHVVMKEIKCETPEEARRRYQQSVRLMDLNNYHVVPFYVVQMPPPAADGGHLVRVFMRYYGEGDLDRFVQRRARNRSPIEEELLRSILLQLTKALHVLHMRSPPIIHGDIKLANVMLFNKGTQVAMADFDTALELTVPRHRRGKSGQRSNEGTHEWMAPEALHHGVAGLKADVFAVGLVIYCMAVMPDSPMIERTSADGKSSYLTANCQEWTQEELARAVVNNVTDRRYSSELAQLIAEMMSHNVNLRPSAQAVYNRTTALMETSIRLDAVARA